MYIPLTFEGALQKCLFASSSAPEGFFISGSQQWKYHWFTGSAALQVQKGTIDNVQIIVVGGGGGGARATANVTPAGGGGGGGVTYVNNARLFAGTYNVVVGKGGAGGSAQNSNGSSGSLSSFIGQNINLVAQGGGGGAWGSGGRGGTSGNGFIGGLATSGNGGGGGGGSTSEGFSSTTTGGGDGGTGSYFNIANYINGFGCGGGGYVQSTSDNPGISCNGLSYGSGGDGNNSGGPGAHRFGMGGGGSPNSNPYGGSGSVIIQYPIFDYCSNYFNETGSCGCLELTMDITDQLNWYPDLTGSYLYMPCGGNQFVSGTLEAYSPETVCVVSGSYFSYNAADYVYNGFATSQWGVTKQCATQSLSPITCSVEWFTPTCSSSIVSIYTPSASVGNKTDFYYVAKNATTHSLVSSTTDQIKYYCISTGSVINGNQQYPQNLAGNFIYLYNTASCNTITLVADWAGKSPSATSQTTYYYYNCNGSKTSVTFSRPSSNFTGALSASFCRDMITPAYFVRSGTSLPTEYLTTGSNCLGANFDTGSCGCP